MKQLALSLSLLLACISMSSAADPSEHLILHYDFENVTNSEVKNLAGENVGTVKGGDSEAIKVVEDSPLVGQTALFCDATRRDAQATFVDSGQSTTRLKLRDQPYTMMAWVKPLRHPRTTRAGDVETIFGQETNPPASFSLGLGTNNRNQMRGMHGGWDNGQSSGSSVVERNAWQHLCWVQQDNMITLYKDGNVIEPEYETFPVVPLVHSADLIIGNSSSVDRVENGDRFSFSGFIDDTRVYNRALTQEEIQEIKLSATKAEEDATISLESPRLSIAFTLAGPQLRWSGLTDAHVIEASTDLQNWAPVTQDSTVEGEIELQVRDESDTLKRFFRVR